MCHLYSNYIIFHLIEYLIYNDKLTSYRNVGNYLYYKYIQYIFYVFQVFRRHCI